MLFLALAVACSLGIATLFKLAERREIDRMALLTVNYAAAAALALALQERGQAEAITAGLVALGVTQGVLFIAGFWLFALAIRLAGMGLAAGVMRLSVAIPVLASWAVWGEAPAPIQMLGLGLAGGAFVLVSRPPGEPEVRAPASGADAAAPEASPPEASGARTALVLGLLFLAGGAVDTLMKAFDEGYAGAVDEALFLLFVFGVAFAVGAVAVVARGLREGAWPGRAALGWGVLLGVINYASADFILRAVAVLSGPVVFPANSVAIVLGAALLGWGLWRERLSRANVAGLALAVVALACLTAGPTAADEPTAEPRPVAGVRAPHG